MKEQLEYDEKVERVSEYIEELFLDAMLAALEKVIRRTWTITMHIPDPHKTEDIQF